jgi:hypothetical protein
MNVLVFGKLLLEGRQFILLHGIVDGFAFLFVGGLALFLSPIVQLPAQFQRSIHLLFLFGSWIKAKLKGHLHMHPSLREHIFPLYPIHHESSTHYRKWYKRKDEGSRQKNSSFRLRLTEIHPLPAEEEDFFRIGVKWGIY